MWDYKRQFFPVVRQMGRNADKNFSIWKGLFHSFARKFMKNRTQTFTFWMLFLFSYEHFDESYEKNFEVSPPILDMGRNSNKNFSIWEDLFWFFHTKIHEKSYSNFHVLNIIFVFLRTLWWVLRKEFLKCRHPYLTCRVKLSYPISTSLLSRHLTSSVYYIALYHHYNMHLQLMRYWIPLIANRGGQHSFSFIGVSGISDVIFYYLGRLGPENKSVIAEICIKRTLYSQYLL